MSERKPLRFKVLYESATGHCCFQYSVVEEDWKESDGGHKVWAECFDKEHAVKICEVLQNANLSPNDYREKP